MDGTEDGGEAGDASQRSGAVPGGNMAAVVQRAAMLALRRSLGGTEELPVLPAAAAAPAAAAEEEEEEVAEEVVSLAATSDGEGAPFALPSTAAPPAQPEAEAPVARSAPPGAACVHGMASLLLTCGDAVCAHNLPKPAVAPLLRGTTCLLCSVPTPFLLPSPGRNLAEPLTAEPSARAPAVPPAAQAEPSDGGSAGGGLEAPSERSAGGGAAAGEDDPYASAAFGVEDSDELEGYAAAFESAGGRVKGR